MGELLTIKQLAYRLQLHPATVYGLIRSSSIEASRLPGGGLRIEVEELERLLSQDRRKTNAETRK